MVILDLLRPFQPGKHSNNILEATLSWATFASPAGDTKALGPDFFVSLQDCPFQNRGVSKSRKGETGYSKCSFCPGTKHTIAFPSVPQLRISIMTITVPWPAFFKPQGHLSPYVVVEKSQLSPALITQRLNEFHATMLEY